MAPQPTPPDPTAAYDANKREASVATFQFQRQHFRCLCAFVAAVVVIVSVCVPVCVWGDDSVRKTAKRRQFFKKQPLTGIQYSYVCE